jgi:hypothetical protein
LETIKQLIMSEILKSTRGTVRQYKDDSIEFIPQGKGEPVEAMHEQLDKLKVDKPFVLGMMLAHIFNR